MHNNNGQPLPTPHDIGAPQPQNSGSDNLHNDLLAGLARQRQGVERPVVNLDDSWNNLDQSAVFAEDRTQDYAAIWLGKFSGSTSIKYEELFVNDIQQLDDAYKLSYLERFRSNRQFKDNGFEAIMLGMIANIAFDTAREKAAEKEKTNPTSGPKVKNGEASSQHVVGNLTQAITEWKALVLNLHNNLNTDNIKVDRSKVEAHGEMILQTYADLTHTAAKKRVEDWKQMGQNSAPSIGGGPGLASPASNNNNVAHAATSASENRGAPLPQTTVFSTRQPAARIARVAVNPRIAALQQQAGLVSASPSSMVSSTVQTTTTVVTPAPQPQPLDAISSPASATTTTITSSASSSRGNPSADFTANRNALAAIFGATTAPTEPTQPHSVPSSATQTTTTVVTPAPQPLLQPASPALSAPIVPVSQPWLSSGSAPGDAPPLLPDHIQRQMGALNNAAVPPTSTVDTTVVQSQPMGAALLGTISIPPMTNTGNIDSNVTATPAIIPGMPNAGGEVQTTVIAPTRQVKRRGLWKTAGAYTFCILSSIASIVGSGVLCNNPSLIVAITQVTATWNPVAVISLGAGGVLLINTFLSGGVSLSAYLVEEHRLKQAIADGATVQDEQPAKSKLMPALVPALVTGVANSAASTTCLLAPQFCVSTLGATQTALSLNSAAFSVAGGGSMAAITIIFIVVGFGCKYLMERPSTPAVVAVAP